MLVYHLIYSLHGAKVESGFVCIKVLHYSCHSGTQYTLSSLGMLGKYTVNNFHIELVEMSNYLAKLRKPRSALYLAV